MFTSVEPVPGRWKGMLDFFKTTVLWKQTFDTHFNSSMSLLKRYDCPALNVARILYREEEGQAQGLLPGEAVFRAIEEFANAYYEEHKDRNDAVADFEELAHALEFAAPNEDSFGGDVAPRSFLSERWIMFLEAYRKHNPQPKA